MTTASPYQPGYDAWAEFDALPENVRRAHHTVYTGIVGWTNQFRTRLCLASLSSDCADSILALDGGSHMLGAADIMPNGSPRYEE